MIMLGCSFIRGVFPPRVIGVRPEFVQTEALCYRCVESDSVKPSCLSRRPSVGHCIYLPHHMPLQVIRQLPWQALEKNPLVMDRADRVTRNIFEAWLMGMSSPGEAGSNSAIRRHMEDVWDTAYKEKDSFRPGLDRLFHRLSLGLVSHVEGSLLPEGREKLSPEEAKVVERLRREAGN